MNVQGIMKHFNVSDIRPLGHILRLRFKKNQLVLVVRPRRKHVDECWKLKKGTFVVKLVVMLHFLIYQCNIWYFRFVEVVSETCVFMIHCIYDCNEHLFALLFRSANATIVWLYWALTDLVFIFCRGTQLVRDFEIQHQVFVLIWVLKRPLTWLCQYSHVTIDW